MSNKRSHRSAAAALLAGAVSVAAAAGVAGQNAPAAGVGGTTRGGDSAWQVPRTADGQPDIQGVWNFAVLTPLERPDALADREVLTEQEAEEFERSSLESRNYDRRDGAGTDADVSRAYNQFWWDYGTSVVSDRRTSLIVDPPDGRVPPLTVEAQERARARAEARRGRGPADSWEDRGMFERCIYFTSPPMTPTAYNNNVEIVQGPGHVVFLHEMIHNARVVPLGGKPHLSSAIQQYAGDSRGRWEGDTLVVETTNFREGAAYRNATGNLKITERFRRVSEDTLMYEFTIEDPATWTRPWTAVIPMTKTDDQIYEYACHEGNYGLVGILSGARAQEKAERDAASGSSNTGSR